MIVRNMAVNSSSLHVSAQRSNETLQLSYARSLRSGDEFIIQMLSKLPDEAVGRVKTILNAGSSIN